MIEISLPILYTIFMEWRRSKSINKNNDYPTSKHLSSETLKLDGGLSNERMSNSLTSQFPLSRSSSGSSQYNIFRSTD
eukprot:Pgem_evm1s1270